MDRQQLIDRLLDHYERPRHYGPLEQADVTLAGGIPDCSDTVTIYLRADAAGERVAELSFEGQGCTISMAAPRWRARARAAPPWPCTPCSAPRTSTASAAGDSPAQQRPQMTQMAQMAYASTDS